MKDMKTSQKSAPARRGPGGVSVRVLSAILFLAATLAIAFSFFELSQTRKHAQLLYELERERLTCDRAIQQFMDGSDYLTRQVQQFVVKGDRTYMDAYWQEINVAKNRDEALAQIMDADLTDEEERMAVAGKAESDSLITGEIWAMRMVSESTGIEEEDMPPEVAALRLEDEDAGLAAEQKRSAAISYIFGPEYSTAKSTIRSKVTGFRSEISNRYGQETLSALSRVKSTSLYMALGTLIFFLLLTGAILCFAQQVIYPLMGFYRNLSDYEEGRPIKLSERGALEIRRFAAAFNELYEQVGQNTRRLEKLGYMDYLTSVPNRASVTEYVEGLIAEGKSPMGVMIIDVDNFKRFNDTYGHAFGDRVLQQVALAVCSVQPEDSGISGRICGEEFVVVSQGADEAALQKTAGLILENVRRITAEDVVLPEGGDFRVTVSIGGMVWRGEQPEDFITLLSKADKALYASKQTGKDKYSLY